MRLIYRVLLMIIALVMLIFTVLAASVALGWYQPLQMLPSSLQVPENRWGVVAVATLLFLISGYLLLGASPHRQDDRWYAIQETELGAVEISSSALEDLICRAARQVREIWEVRPVLRRVEGGISILLHLKSMPEANLPEVTNNVQHAVQSFLEGHAGVRVLQVEVRIDSVSLEHRARVE
jgi:uncharacterized alkaline shock family protein YloU